MRTVLGTGKMDGFRAFRRGHCYILGSPTRREQLARLGAPGGRVTTMEDGHPIEIYQYFADGVRIGEIRLSGGLVSQVRSP